MDKNSLQLKNILLWSWIVDFVENSQKIGSIKKAEKDMHIIYPHIQAGETLKLRVIHQVIHIVHRKIKKLSRLT